MPFDCCPSLDLPDDDCVHFGVGHRLVPSNYDAAMQSLYGMVPSVEEPSCLRESRPEHGHWA